MMGRDGEPRPGPRTWVPSGVPPPQHVAAATEPVFGSVSGGGMLPPMVSSAPPSHVNGAPSGMPAPSAHGGETQPTAAVLSNYLRVVVHNSEEFQSLCNMVRASYLNNYNEFEPQRIFLINNRKLKESYLQRAQQIGGDEKATFLSFTQPEPVCQIILKGLQLRRLPLNRIGDSRRGVYVCRHADLCLQIAGNTANSVFLIIFLVTPGRTKGIEPGNMWNTWPDRDYHSAVSSRLPRVQDSQFDRIANSFMYAYEYDGAGAIQQPRHVLPCAVMEMRRTGVAPQAGLTPVHQQPRQTREPPASRIHSSRHLPPSYHPQTSVSSHAGTNSSHWTGSRPYPHPSHTSSSSPNQYPQHPSSSSSSLPTQYSRHSSNSSASLSGQYPQPLPSSSASLTGQYSQHPSSSSSSLTGQYAQLPSHSSASMRHQYMNHPLNSSTHGPTGMSRNSHQMPPPYHSTMQQVPHGHSAGSQHRQQRPHNQAGPPVTSLYPHLSNATNPTHHRLPHPASSMPSSLRQWQNMNQSRLENTHNAFPSASIPQGHNIGNRIPPGPSSCPETTSIPTWHQPAAYPPLLSEQPAASSREAHPISAAVPLITEGALPTASQAPTDIYSLVKQAEEQFLSDQSAAKIVIQPETSNQSESSNQPVAANQPVTCDVPQPQFPPVSVSPSPSIATPPLVIAPVPDESHVSRSFLDGLTVPISEPTSTSVVAEEPSLLKEWIVKQEQQPGSSFSRQNLGMVDLTLDEDEEAGWQTDLNDTQEVNLLTPVSSQAERSIDDLFSLTQLPQDPIHEADCSLEDPPAAEPEGVEDTPSVPEATGQTQPAQEPGPAAQDIKDHRGRVLSPVASNHEALEPITIPDSPPAASVDSPQAASVDSPQAASVDTGEVPAVAASPTPFSPQPVVSSAGKDSGRTSPTDACSDGDSDVTVAYALESLEALNEFMAALPDMLLADELSKQSKSAPEKTKATPEVSVQSCDMPSPATKGPQLPLITKTALVDVGGATLVPESPIEEPSTPLTGALPNLFPEPPIVATHPLPSTGTSLPAESEAEAGSPPSSHGSPPVLDLEIVEIPDSPEPRSSPPQLNPICGVTAAATVDNASEPQENEMCAPVPPVDSVSNIESNTNGLVCDVKVKSKPNVQSCQETPREVRSSAGDTVTELSVVTTPTCHTPDSSSQPESGPTDEVPSVVSMVEDLPMENSLAEPGSNSSSSSHKLQPGVTETLETEPVASYPSHSTESSDSSSSEDEVEVISSYPAELANMNLQIFGECIQLKSKEVMCQSGRLREGLVPYQQSVVRVRPDGTITMDVVQHWMRADQLTLSTREKTGSSPAEPPARTSFQQNPIPEVKLKDIAQPPHRHQQQPNQKFQRQGSPGNDDDDDDTFPNKTASGGTDPANKHQHQPCQQDHGQGPPNLNSNDAPPKKTSSRNADPADSQKHQSDQHQSDQQCQVQRSPKVDDSETSPKKTGSGHVAEIMGEISKPFLFPFNLLDGKANSAQCQEQRASGSEKQSSKEPTDTLRTSRDEYSGSRQNKKDTPVTPVAETNSGLENGDKLVPQTIETNSSKDRNHCKLKNQTAEKNSYEEKGHQRKSLSKSSHEGKNREGQADRKKSRISHETPSGQKYDSSGPVQEMTSIAMDTIVSVPSRVEMDIIQERVAGSEANLHMTCYDNLTSPESEAESPKVSSPLTLGEKHDGIPDDDLPDILPPKRRKMRVNMRTYYKPGYKTSKSGFHSAKKHQNYSAHKVPRKHVAVAERHVSPHMVANQSVAAICEPSAVMYQARVMTTAPIQPAADVVHATTVEVKTTVGRSPASEQGADVSCAPVNEDSLDVMAEAPAIYPQVTVGLAETAPVVNSAVVVKGAATVVAAESALRLETTTEYDAPDAADETVDEVDGPVVAGEIAADVDTPVVATETAADVDTPVVATETAADVDTPVVATETAADVDTPVVATETAADVDAPVVATETAADADAPVVATETAADADAPVVATETAADADAPVVATETAADADAPVVAAETAADVDAPDMSVKTTAGGDTVEISVERDASVVAAEEQLAFPSPVEVGVYDVAAVPSPSEVGGHEEAKITSPVEVAVYEEEIAVKSPVEVEIYEEDRAVISPVEMAVYEEETEVTSPVEMKVYERETAVISPVEVEVYERETAVTSPVEVEVYERETAVISPVEVEVYERETAVISPVEVAVYGEERTVTPSAEVAPQQAAVAPTLLEQHSSMVDIPTPAAPVPTEDRVPAGAKEAQMGYAMPVEDQVSAADPATEVDTADTMPVEGSDPAADPATEVDTADTMPVEDNVPAVDPATEVDTADTMPVEDNVPAVDPATEVDTADTMPVEGSDPAVDPATEVDTADTMPVEDNVPAVDPATEVDTADTMPVEGSDPAADPATEVDMADTMPVEGSDPAADPATEVDTADTMSVESSDPAADPATEVDRPDALPVEDSDPAVDPATELDRPDTMPVEDSSPAVAPVTEADTADALPVEDSDPAVDPATEVDTANALLVEDSGPAVSPVTEAEMADVLPVKASVSTGAPVTDNSTATNNALSLCTPGTTVDELPEDLLLVLKKHLEKSLAKSSGDLSPTDTEEEEQMDTTTKENDARQPAYTNHSKQKYHKSLDSENCKERSSNKYKTSHRDRRHRDQHLSKHSWSRSPKREKRSPKKRTSDIAVHPASSKTFRKSRSPMSTMQQQADQRRSRAPASSAQRIVSAAGDTYSRKHIQVTFISQKDASSASELSDGSTIHTEDILDAASESSHRVAESQDKDEHATGALVINLNADAEANTSLTNAAPCGHISQSNVLASKKSLEAAPATPQTSTLAGVSTQQAFHLASSTTSTMKMMPAVEAVGASELSHLNSVSSNISPSGVDATWTHGSSTHHVSRPISSSSASSTVPTESYPKTSAASSLLVGYSTSSALSLPKPSPPSVSHPSPSTDTSSGRHTPIPLGVEVRSTKQLPPNLDEAIAFIADENKHVKQRIRLLEGYREQLKSNGNLQKAAACQLELNRLKVDAQMLGDQLIVAQGAILTHRKLPQSLLLPDETTDISVEGVPLFPFVLVDKKTRKKLMALKRGILSRQQRYINASNCKDGQTAKESLIEFHMRRQWYLSRYCDCEHRKEAVSRIDQGLTWFRSVLRQMKEHQSDSELHYQRISYVVERIEIYEIHKALLELLGKTKPLRREHVLNYLAPRVPKDHISRSIRRPAAGTSAESHAECLRTPTDIHADSEYVRAPTDSGVGSDCMRMPTGVDSVRMHSDVDADSLQDEVTPNDAIWAHIGPPLVDANKVINIVPVEPEPSCTLPPGEQLVQTDPQSTNALVDLGDSSINPEASHPVPVSSPGAEDDSCVIVQVEESKEARKKSSLNLAAKKAGYDPGPVRPSAEFIQRVRKLLCEMTGKSTKPAGATPSDVTVQTPAVGGSLERGQSGGALSGGGSAVESSSGAVPKDYRESETVNQSSKQGTHSAVKSPIKGETKSHAGKSGKQVSQKTPDTVQGGRRSSCEYDERRGTWRSGDMKKIASLHCKTDRSHSSSHSKSPSSKKGRTLSKDDKDPHVKRSTSPSQGSWSSPQHSRSSSQNSSSSLIKRKHSQSPGGDTKQRSKTSHRYSRDCSRSPPGRPIDIKRKGHSRSRSPGRSSDQHKSHCRSRSPGRLSNQRKCRSRSRSPARRPRDQRKGSRQSRSPHSHEYSHLGRTSKSSRSPDKHLKHNGDAKKSKSTCKPLESKQKNGDKCSNPPSPGTASSSQKSNSKQQRPTSSRSPKKKQNSGPRSRSRSSSISSTLSSSESDSRCRLRSRTRSRADSISSVLSISSVSSDSLSMSLSPARPSSQSCPNPKRKGSQGHSPSPKRKASKSASSSPKRKESKLADLGSKKKASRHNSRSPKRKPSSPEQSSKPKRSKDPSHKTSKMSWASTDSEYASQYSAYMQQQYKVMQQHPLPVPPAASYKAVSLPVPPQASYNTGGYSQAPPMMLAPSIGVSVQYQLPPHTLSTQLVPSAQLPPTGLPGQYMASGQQLGHGWMQPGSYYPPSNYPNWTTTYKPP